MNPPQRRKKVKADCMQKAYENILDEIMNYMIECVCFEIHRALKLGYYPFLDYDANEQQSESNRSMAEPEGDIFFNDLTDEIPMSTCQYCAQKKAAHTLARHMRSCRKDDDPPFWCRKQKEVAENDVEDAAAFNCKDVDRVALNDIPASHITVDHVAWNSIAMNDGISFVKNHKKSIATHDLPEHGTDDEMSRDYEDYNVHEEICDTEEEEDIADFIDGDDDDEDDDEEEFTDEDVKEEYTDDL